MIAQNVLESKSPLTNKEIQVYLRNTKKIAILISLTLPITGRQLGSTIASRMFLKAEEMALFSNGKVIDIKAEKHVDLKHRNIIHVVNLAKTQYQTLKIHFRQSAKAKDAAIVLEVKGDSQIKQVLQNDLKKMIGKDERQVFLVYLGHPLNIFKTFRQQLAEDECEIMILQFKEEYHVRMVNDSMNNNNTIDYSMPNKGSRAHQSTQFNKLKNTTANTSQPPANPKPETNEDALSNAAPANFTGFDPHLNDQAPPLIPAIYPEYKAFSQANVSVPFKQKDLLFGGNTILEQTQNVIEGEVVAQKKMFLKKMGGDDAGKGSMQAEK